MLYLIAWLIIGCQIPWTKDCARYESPDFPPIANAKEVADKIYASGGDAEIVRGYIILVTLRNTTDDSFELLKPLRAVRYLDCGHCEIDGSGMANIAQMERLEKLQMYNNTFNQKHFVHIAKLPRLRVLNLDETNVNDEGISHVANLCTLEYLYLSNTNVSDKSIPVFAKLKNLKAINVSGSQMTQAGVERLRKLLPDTKIWPGVR